MKGWVIAILSSVFMLPSLAMAQEATPFPLSNPLGLPNNVYDGEGVRIDYFRFVTYPGKSANEFGYLVVGEMTNITAEQIVAPALQFTFTDSKGSLYWQNQSYPTQSFIEPGETAAFWLDVSESALNQATGASSLEVTACHTELYSEKGGGNLKITSSPLEFSSESQSYSGQVEITNVGSVDVSQPAIYLVSHDADGLVDFVDYEILNGPIGPGALTRGAASLSAPDSDNVEFSADEFGMLGIGCPRP